MTRVNDDYIKENFIPYNQNEYIYSNEDSIKGKKGKKCIETDYEEMESKEKTGIRKGTVFIIIGFVFIFIALGVGASWCGISLYKEKQAEEEAANREKKYQNLLKKAEECFEDEEYDDAMDNLEAALDIKVDNYKDVYKLEGNVYIGYAGKEYVEAKKYEKNEKYDMAFDSLDEARAYLDKAEKAWKKGKGKINSDVFYDCKSISDIRLLIDAREEDIIASSEFATVALELFSNAEQYLIDEDYDLMNELDCSDDSNDVYNHYVGSVYGGRLIASITGSGLELVDDIYTFNGYGISQNYTSTGFYYYMGDFNGGTPNGDGILYISSTNGDYHVEIGNFNNGYITGECTYIVRESGKVTKYEGNVSDWGHLDGEITVTRECKGQTCTGIAYYEVDLPVSMAEYMDDEEYEALVKELNDDVIDNGPYSKAEEEYYVFLYNKKGELVGGLHESDMTTDYLHY